MKTSHFLLQSKSECNVNWWTFSNTFGVFYTWCWVTEDICSFILALSKMSSYANLTAVVFSHLQHECKLSSNVWKIFTNSSSLTFCPLQKRLVLIEKWVLMARFQLISMSTYAKNKLQMSSLTQHMSRCRQMCRKLFTNSPSTLYFLSVTKNGLSWLNNPLPWQGLTRYDVVLMLTNKQEMFSVKQHQCGRRQMCGTRFSPSPLTLVTSTKKDLS